MTLKAKSPSAQDNAGTSGTSLQGNSITREISCCLLPCNQCTGLYVDNIRGDFLHIVCRHRCHLNESVKNPR